MSDEPTLGELARRFEDRLADVRDDIQTLGFRLDSRVSMERYQLEREAMAKELQQITERVRGIEVDREQEQRQRDTDQRAVEDRRRADRRLAFTALVAPVILLILQAYIAARGAGS
ncbi:MAG: hypothetical protein LBV60_00780 [Streptomyces sp.]|jgi:cell division protein ZapA (FtsZ GTPase activity inhibitor)|nr:hypothetical protein [Streptomyces sp.]